MKKQTQLINSYLNGDIKLESLIESKSTFLNDKDLGIDNFQDFLGRLVTEKLEREMQSPNIQKIEPKSKNRTSIWSSILKLK